MNERIYSGNAIEDGRDTRGWLAGDFIDPASLGHSDDVEIKWGVHLAGERRDEWSTGVHERTYSILISGRFRLIFPDHEVVLERQGDYAVWAKGVDHKWVAEADATILTVRWPSVRG